MQRGAAGARSAIGLAAVVVAATASLGCGGQEDWGGPRGPAPVAPAPAAIDPAPVVPIMPAASVTTTAASAASVASARDGGTGSAGTAAQVTAEIRGGKVTGFDGAIGRMRPALKACVEGRGDVNAVVELSAPIDAKGNVGKMDSLGGSQFGQGAVACLVRRIEGASFAKPESGSPRFTIRVKLVHN